MSSRLRNAAWGPLMRALDEREQRIARKISDAEKVNQEALAKVADYEAKIAHAKEEAAEIIAEEVLADRLELYKWDDQIEKWIARVNCLAEGCPDYGIPIIDDEARRAMVQEICSSDTASIQPPIRMMYPVSPRTTPLSMMSALRLGKSSDAMVATSCRATT